MKTFIVAFVIALSGTAAAYYVRLPFAYRPPEFIIVGTLEAIERGTFEEPMQPIPGSPSITMHVYDTGWVRPDTVLYGDPSVSRVQIAWIARARLEPPAEGCSVSTTAARDYEEGDRRIWVIRPVPAEVKYARDYYRWFQTEPVDSLPRVLRELREFLASGGSRPDSPPK